MKSNKFQLVILGFVTLVLITTQSCSPELYTPSPQVVPILEERGDLKIGAEVSMVNPLYSLLVIGSQGSFRLRGSYGITDFLGIHLETGLSLDTTDYREHYGAAIGYYSHLDQRVFTQVYLLGRTGQVDYDGDGSWSGAPLKASYRSIGIQPSFGYETDQVTIGLFTTLKSIYYYELDAPGNARDQATLLEPTIGFSWKFMRNFSLDAEIGLSFELAKKTAYQSYFGFGLGFNLNSRKKMRRSPRRRR